MRSDDDGIPGDFTAVDYEKLTKRQVSEAEQERYDEEKKHRDEKNHRQALASVAEEYEDENEEAQEEPPAIPSPPMFGRGPRTRASARLEKWEVAT